MKKLLIILGVAVLVFVLGVVAFGVSRSTDSEDQMVAGDRSATLSEQMPGLATRDASTDSAGKSAVTDPATGPIESTMIRTGNLSMITKDLQRDLTTIKSLVATLGGQVSNESSSGSRGASRDNQYAELTVRVPESKFEQAMRQIGETARVTHREINAEDVHTQVIDVNARVKSKRASVESLEKLLAKATTIGEVMSVERELSARQADLDSLVQQQKYLSDQTSMSTIQVTLASPDRADELDRDGFVGGLQTGWSALTGFLVGVLTVTGVLLPWLPLIALVVLPGWWWLRRRTTSKPTSPVNT